MRERNCVKVLVPLEGPKNICECGQPIYDGRRKKCPACAAAIKKCNEKRRYVHHDYAFQEKILAEITEMDNSVKMQEFCLQQTKKKLAYIRSLVMDI